MYAQLFQIWCQIKLVLTFQPGLELAQGHRGHDGLWCPLPWPWSPICQGILQYVVASGALVQWP